MNYLNQNYCGDTEKVILLYLSREIIPKLNLINCFMMIEIITITCPDCQNKFTGRIILSYNTFNGVPNFDNEDFSSTRKCPQCGKLVDITNGKNWIYTSEEKHSKIKEWLKKLLS